MRLIPVLFEDHSLTHFRPLTWSQPTYEIRTGLFSLRERMELLDAPGQNRGVLLGRSFLADLQNSAEWSNGAEAGAEAMTAEDSVALWINGRASWGINGLRELRERVLSGDQIRLRDDHGLLAFSCAAPLSGQVLASWRAWEASSGHRACLAMPGRPMPEWQPELGPEGIGFHTGEALSWIWDIVPATPSAIAGDLAFLGGKTAFSRAPFGVFPLEDEAQAIWTRPSSLSLWNPDQDPGEAARISVENPQDFWCGPEVILGAGLAVNATCGPVILDRNVTVMPGCYLEGPLYIGPGSIVKPGAAVFGESSFGILNRISGEIGESTFGDFANKQHDGFIGHAVLGSWVNLGAMTTCSDLKNNYGNVRVDLGEGQVDTGLRFVGLLMGDHAKTAIGTLFNTGTCVGFASNIFGTGMPPKFVGNFSWGGQEDSPGYAVDRALQTAEVVLARRGCRLTDAHKVLFRTLGAEL